MKIKESDNYEKILKEKRKSFEYYYTELILNKWLSKFTIKGLNYKQVRFFLMNLWSIGSVAICRPNNYKTLESEGLDELLGEYYLLVVKYAPTDYRNIYNFPTHALPINNKGVNFIPTTPLEIDKEIVIIYAQANHHSIYESIKSKIDKIVDLEMILYACNKIQKSSWTLGIDLDDKMAERGILNQLMSDKPFVIATLEQLKDVKGFANNSVFVSDKFEQMIQANLNEIYTYLGFDNIGVLEKKEHLLNSEVDANNDVLQVNNDSFIEQIGGDLKRASEVFNKELSIELKNKVIQEDSKENKGENENDKD